MKKPAISVIIPAYNHAKYIRQCVDSVLDQTFTDIEIMVVDDGSTDGTSEILKEYRGRLTLIEQANRGTQSARNTAIRASSGRYIALLDSDDVWLPHKLQRQLAVFERYPDAGLAYAQAYIIDAQGAHLNAAVIGKAIIDPNESYQQILIENPVPALTALIRKECLDEIGLFDETLVGASDWDLWLRIAARWPVVCINEPLALYRVHLANTTNALRKSKALFMEHMYVLEKAFSCSAMPVPKRTRDSALARAHLIGAELAAMGGSATEAREELESAVELDATVLGDTVDLEGKLIFWSQLYAAASPQGNPYQHFADQVFAALAPVLPNASRLRRSVLSKSVMGTVFSAHAAGDHKTVRQLLPSGVYADPTWLLNRGVWSIAAHAYLGAKIATPLRQKYRRPSVSQDH